MPRSAHPAKIFFVLLAFFFAFAPLSATIPGGDPALERELRRDVEFLSDTLCAGRRTGTPGGSEAAFFIVRRLVSLGYSVEIQAFATEDGRVGHNIVAYFAGSGGTAPKASLSQNILLAGGVSSSGTKAAGRRPILLMTYYDGMGHIGERFYPGADSNASGVAALLSLAGALRGRHDLIFAFTDAHNANMAGAEQLSAALARVPLRMVLNFDILGSTLAPPHSYWKDYLIVLGGAAWKRSLADAGALHLYFDYYGSRSFTDLFYRRICDHKFFLNRGVPVLMFTSGITMQTNREGDVAATLDYPIFAKRVMQIRSWLESL